MLRCICRPWVKEKGKDGKDFMRNWVKQVMAFSVVSLLMCAVVGIIVPMQAKGSGDFLDGQTIPLSMLGMEAASGSNATYQPASKSNAAVLTITGSGVTLTGDAASDIDLKVVVKAASGSNAELKLDEASWSNNVDELLVFHTDATLTVAGESVLTQDFSKNWFDTVICKAEGKLAIVGEDTSSVLRMFSKSYNRDSQDHLKFPENGVLDVKGLLELKKVELDLLRDTEFNRSYSDRVLGKCNNLNMEESVLYTPGTLKLTGKETSKMDQKSLILLENSVELNGLKVTSRECLTGATKVEFYGRTIEVQNPNRYITPVATDSNAQIPDFTSHRDEGIKYVLNLGYLSTLERDAALEGYWHYDYEKDELTLSGDNMHIIGKIKRKKTEDGSAGRAFHIIAEDTVKNITISEMEITNENAMEAPAILFKADNVKVNVYYLHLTTTGAGIEARDLDLYGNVYIDSKGDGIRANDVIIEDYSRLYGAFVGDKESNNNLNLTGDLTAKNATVQVNSQNKNVPALKAKTVTLEEAAAVGAYNSKEGKDLEVNGLNVNESLLVSYTGGGIGSLEPEFVKIPEDASRECINYNEPYNVKVLFSARVNADGTVNSNGKYYLHNTKYAIVDEFNLFGTGEKNIYTVTLNAINGKFKKSDGSLTDKVELTVNSEVGFRQSQEFELVPDEGYEIGNYKEFRNILSWYYGPNQSYEKPLNYICVAMDWYWGNDSSWYYETDYMTIADLETQELDIVFPKIGHAARTLNFSVDPQNAEFTAPEEAAGKLVYSETVEPGKSSKTVKIKVKDGYTIWGWTISPGNWNGFDTVTKYDAETKEYCITVTVRSDILNEARDFSITPYIVKTSQQHTSSGGTSSSSAPGIWKQAEDGKGWIYTDYKGNPLTGWRNYKNCWYLLDDNGRMQTGWKQVNGKWYYLHDSGMMATGWLLTGDTWYYLNKNGDMATGWISLGDKWYYLDENGAMVSDGLTPDGYYVDKNGVWNYKAPEPNQ